MSVDYGRIINTAWKISWKNRWLWVYGLVLVAFGGGGFGSGGGGGGGGGGSNSVNTLNLPDIPREMPQTRDVLGAATSAITDWIVGVPASAWLALGAGILLLFTIGVVVGIVVRNWAKGAIIQAIERAANLQPVTLAATAPQGFVHLKNLILLGFLHSGIILLSLIALIMSMLPLLVIAAKPPAAVIIATVIIAVIGFFSWLFFVVIAGFVGIYSDRLIVLHGRSPWSAWKSGFHLARRRFFPALIMGMINNSLGCAVGCAGLILLLVILGLPIYFILRPSFISGFRFPTPLQIIPSVILILIGLNLQLLVAAFLTVFRYSTWNLFVREILEEEKIV